MADQVTVDNGDLANYDVSTDDAGASGHVQRVKLAYSADGSATHVQADADGVLVNLGANNDVVVSDGGGSVSVDDGGSSLTVDGTVGVAGTVTVDSELPSAAALADNTANPTVPGVGAFGLVYDGSTWDRAPGNSTDGTLVNLGANNDVTVTGTVTANLAAGTNNIGDVDVLTVPAPLSTTGGGTEAAALRVTVATDSTGVLSVDDNGSTLSVDDGGGSLTVDGTVTVTGVATAANQSTIIGHVDGIEGLLTTIDGDTGTLAGAVSGSEMQVDVVGALPAGDNAVGRVKLTDGTDVADVLDLTNSNPLTVAVVDGAGSQITSFGGGTQYTEGDTDASITGTALLWEDTGDTLRAASASKPLPVAIISGGGSGGTAMTDDAAFTPGSTSVTPIGAMFDDASPDSVNEGDGGVVRMSGNRNLYVTLRDAAGNERGLNVDANGAIAVTDGGNTLSVDDGGASLTVDGTVAVSSLPASTNTIEVVGDAAHDTPVAGNPVLIGAEFDDTSPDSVDEGDVGRLRISANRNLYSTIRDAAGNERGANVNASNQLSVSVDNTVTVASHAVTNAGTFATQESGAALTALQLIDDTIFTDDAAFTVATSKVSAAGYLADETSTDSVDEGDAGIARMTLDRKQVVVNQPHTAGGCSIFRSIDLDESEEEVKATAGCVYGWWITNLATSTRYVKFYNATAASTTVGTTTPVLTLPIPGNSSDDIAANMLGGVGITFDTAITVAATTGLADGDTGAPGANEVVINLFYK